jgi:hypothetical protein
VENNFSFVSVNTKFKMDAAEQLSEIARRCLAATSSTSYEQEETDAPSPVIRNGQEAMALLTHACMLAAGFRLVGLAEGNAVYLLIIIIVLIGTIIQMTTWKIIVADCRPVGIIWVAGTLHSAIVMSNPPCRSW